MDETELIWARELLKQTLARCVRVLETKAMLEMAAVQAAKRRLGALK